MAEKCWCPLPAFKILKYLKSYIIKAEFTTDCIDNGWVMTGYPNCGQDFENLDRTRTPPNRIIFLNLPWESCRTRIAARGIDWCTGRAGTIGSPNVFPDPRDDFARLENELDYYFSEASAELRAAAGVTAIQVNAQETIEQVQTKIQAAVMAAPAFNIECCTTHKDIYD